MSPNDSAASQTPLPNTSAPAPSPSVIAAAGTPGATLPIITPDRVINGTGVVKWFDPKKGFGFIVGPEGQDIFAHYSKIEGDGFRVLSDGTQVQYDAERGDKGWHASRIIRVEVSETGVVAARRSYSRTSRR